MRIVKVEVVTRYQVEFTPAETRVLSKYERWAKVISITSSIHNGHGRNPMGRATLTKRQINDVCDELGVNGREFMAGAVQC